MVSLWKESTYRAWRFVSEVMDVPPEALMMTNAARDLEAVDEAVK